MNGAGRLSVKADQTRRGDDACSQSSPPSRTSQVAVVDGSIAWPTTIDPYTDEFAGAMESLYRTSFSPGGRCHESALDHVAAGDSVQGGRGIDQDGAGERSGCRVDVQAAIYEI